MTSNLSGKILTVEFTSDEMEVIHYIVKKHTAGFFQTHLESLLKGRSVQMEHETRDKVWDKVRKNKKLQNQILAG